MTTADKLTRLKTDFDDVYNKGYEQGKAEGSTDSYYDTFWDAFQQNGERTGYNYAFFNQQAWNNSNWKPKYNMNISNGTQMFRECGDIDMIERLKEQNITFDTSQATDLNHIFYLAQVTTIPEISCVNTKNDNLTMLFNGSKQLHTIKKFIIQKRHTGGSSLFSNCLALENIVIEGEIGSNIDFKNSSLLTVESAKSILLALVNYTGTENEGVNKVTFHSDVWVRLDAEGNTAPDGMTWRDYTENKGWNN